VKGLARLILFFIPVFLFVMVSGATLAVARAWIGAMNNETSQSIRLLVPIFESLPSILIFAAYLSVLASLSYAAQHEIGSIKSIIVISLFTAGFLVLFTYGTETLSKGPFSGPSLRGRALGTPGLVLNASQKGNDDRFGLAAPVLGGTVSADFTSSGARLSDIAAQGLVPLALYALTLASLLASFRFLASFTSWPVANLSLCAVFFWIVMNFDAFLASATFRRFSSPFLPEFILPYLVPLILAITALLVDLYAILRALSMGRGKRRE